MTKYFLVAVAAVALGAAYCYPRDAGPPGADQNASVSLNANAHVDIGKIPHDAILAPARFAIINAGLITTEDSARSRHYIARTANSRKHVAINEQRFKGSYEESLDASSSPALVAYLVI